MSLLRAHPAGTDGSEGCWWARGAGGTARDGIGAQIAVRDLGRLRKRPVLDDSGTVSSLVPFSWGWGAGANPGTPFWGIHSAPPPAGNLRVPIAPPTASQPRELLPRREANLEPPGHRRGPAGRCCGDAGSGAPRAGGTRGGRLPESTKRTWLGVAPCPPLCLGLACLGKGPGAPKPAPHLPQAPFPSWKEKRNRK